MLGGFRFSETMAGSWTPETGGEPRPIRFSVTARARSLFKHLLDHKTSLEGTLWMDGFAAGAPVDGELTINPLLGKLIRYEFGFTADDGKRYRFAGQKDVSLLELAETMTTLPATITDERGTPVARALLRFDKRDLPSFIASFRPGT